MDKLAFLDGPEAAETPAVIEAPAESAPAPEAPPEAPPAPAEPARDEHGRFAAKDAPAAAQPSAEAPPVAAAVPVAPPVAAEAKPEPGFVPLAAVLDARDRAKEAQAQAKDFERQLNELRKAQATPPAPPPSMFEDEAAYTAHIQQQIANGVLENRFDMSELAAKEKHGAEAVDEAWQAALAHIQKSPAFKQEILSSRHPIEFAFQWHKREQTLAELKDEDLVKFREWKAAQAAAPAAAAPIAQAPIAAAAPPPPLAAPPPLPNDITNMPSAGGVASGPVGSGTAFEATFK